MYVHIWFFLVEWAVCCLWSWQGHVWQYKDHCWPSVPERLCELASSVLQSVLYTRAQHMYCYWLSSLITHSKTNQLRHFGWQAFIKAVRTYWFLISACAWACEPGVDGWWCTVFSSVTQHICYSAWDTLKYIFLQHNCKHTHNSHTVKVLTYVAWATYGLIGVYNRSPSAVWSPRDIQLLVCCIWC